MPAAAARIDLARIGLVRDERDEMLGADPRGDVVAHRVFVRGDDEIGIAA